MRYDKICTACAMAAVSELMFWSARGRGHAKCSAYDLSAVQTHESATHEALFSTQTVAVCFESACVESMAECQSLDRDGATAVTELSSSDSGALKSGGNPLPTAHDVITLTTARGGGSNCRPWHDRTACCNLILIFSLLLTKKFHHHRSVLVSE